MQDLLFTFVSYLVILAEFFGAMVVLFGILRAIWGYIRAIVRPEALDSGPLRHGLGQSLVFAIEFLVAADILRTAMAPTWEDLLKLGALILLRTVLNYLLELEHGALHPDSAGHRLWERRGRPKGRADSDATEGL
jgi:uncharacterized membrane protein